MFFLEKKVNIFLAFPLQTQNWKSDRQRKREWKSEWDDESERGKKAERATDKQVSGYR